MAMGKDNGTGRNVLIDEGKLAEKPRTGGSPGIWIYLIPVFILAAWPAYKLFQKANADSIELSPEDTSAFHYDRDAARPAAGAVPGVPELEDRVLNVRYKSGGTAAGELAPQGQTQPSVTRQPAAEPAGLEQASRGTGAARTAEVRGGHPSQALTGGPQAADARSAASSSDPASYGRTASDPLKAREQQSVGYTKGLITGIMEKAINNPKAVGAVLNNGNIVSGFMARPSVRSATGSVEGLSAYLKTAGPANFLNNPLVQSALGNQAVISAAASSGLVKAMLETPAAKELMRDPKALNGLISSNPQLTAMAEKNPQAVKALTGNPEVARLLGRFDTSFLNKK